MPPKKEDKKKQQLAVNQGPPILNITDDELAEAENLPQLNDFVFTNIFAFKMCRNQVRLTEAITKHFQFVNPEEPGYSEANAKKFRTVDYRQLIGLAQAKGMITEAELNDIANYDRVKLRQILAKATKQSVTAHQIQMMKEKSKTEAATSKDKLHSTDQFIYLRDFPQTPEDLKELIQIGFDKLSGVNLIEETWNREIEDDNDDVLPSEQDLKTRVEEYLLHQGVQSVLPPVENPPPFPEKMLNKLPERAKVFENVVQINQILKQQPQGSKYRNCLVQRLKFLGPANPLTIPPKTNPEEQDPEAHLDEATKTRKHAEFKFYTTFAGKFTKEIEQISCLKQEYQSVKDSLQDKAKPLWKTVLTKDQLELKNKLEEIRAKKLEQQRLKEEEERKAAEAAAAAKKGPAKGKAPVAPPKESPSADKQIQPQTDPEEAAMEAKLKEFDNLPKSVDDNPARKREFMEFKKLLSETSSGDASIGTILGTMVYQIGEMKEKRHQAGLDQTKAKQNTDRSKSLSRISTRKVQAPMQGQELNKMFDEVLQNLNVDFSIKETNFKHVFATNKHCCDCSPYITITDENNKIDLHSSKVLPDGKPQGYFEDKTLVHQQLPGVNNRFGMPDKESESLSVREADQNSIINFCQLPPPMVKRCLILRAFEKMMRDNQPEQSFSFLDRNFVQEFNDKQTTRQILSSTLTEMSPDVVTNYYSMQDALLIAMYNKNPPGRLLRDQWTYNVASLPDFTDWKNIIKEEGLTINPENLIDISNEKLGVLRSNFKYSFPSDNSYLRVEKHLIGQRRMGISKVIKDNIMFGIKEQQQKFNKKVHGEDQIRNMDAKIKADKICDFWLLFDNGLRLTVEMQDHQAPNMKEIPKSKMPRWLINKLERERRAAMSQEDDYSESGQGTVVATSQPDPNQMSISQADMTDSHEKITIQDSKEKIPPAQPAQDVVPEEASVHHEEEKDDPEWQDSSLTIDGVDMTKGAKLTFTFKEGLVVQILPSGDIVQQYADGQPSNKNALLQQQTPDSQRETKRIITQDGNIIKYFADGNFTIYLLDGTITQSDNRKRIWYTTNSKGVRRVRRLQDGTIVDELERLKINSKIDPETNALVQIREDKVLRVDYVDDSSYLIFPDGTKVLKKKRPDGEAGTHTYIVQDGYIPVRLVYDPVKARARTIIGLGGTDALMGKDNIMERSNNGKVSELLLPDHTVVQTYQEKQELPGYNQFSLNTIHLIRRADFSIVKVSQNGEVVVITANERAYLNSIGKQVPEFGFKDYDFFFELYGVPNERRSGVYTANLDRGRIWSQDEEGNFFIVYANGDSVEKMSVSFDLNQLVEGIENKEPTSPRIQDGEFIENECKFLPPPKSIAHPRLFFVTNEGKGMEFSNAEQVKHLFRTNANRKDKGFFSQSDKVLLNNEECINHVFITKQFGFNPQAYNIQNEFPKLPQCLELVNQTVSIPTEPVFEQYSTKTVKEYAYFTHEMQNEFYKALNNYNDLVANQHQTQENLKVTTPVVATTAVPTDEKKERARGMSFADAQSTLHGSQLSEIGSDLGSVGSANRRLNRKLRNQVPSTKRSEVEQSALPAQTISDEILIDEDTGIQKVQADISLSFTQRLQLRIANHRKINVETLKDDEFEALKKYQQQKQREHKVNNLLDFFDE